MKTRRLRLSGVRVNLFRKRAEVGPSFGVACFLSLAWPAFALADAQVQTQQQRAPEKETQSEALEASAASLSERSSDPTDRMRDLSLGVSLGMQGSPLGKEAIGVRYGLDRDFFAGLYLQHGFDDRLDAEAYAAYVESGYDLVRRGRGKLAMVGTLAGGFYRPSSTTPASRTVGGSDRSDDLFLGFAAGLQIEVWILAEISLALKAEWGGQVMPNDLHKFSTASSELQVFLHLDGGSS